VCLGRECCTDLGWSPYAIHLVPAAVALQGCGSGRTSTNGTDARRRRADPRKSIKTVYANAFGAGILPVNDHRSYYTAFDNEDGAKRTNRILGTRLYRVTIITSARNLTRFYPRKRFDNENYKCVFFSNVLPLIFFKYFTRVCVFYLLHLLYYAHLKNFYYFQIAITKMILSEDRTCMIYSHSTILFVS
jgi:hypothetical protein